MAFFNGAAILFHLDCSTSHIKIKNAPYRGGVSLFWQVKKNVCRMRLLDKRARQYYSGAYSLLLVRATTTTTSTSTSITTSSSSSYTGGVTTSTNC